MPVQASPGGVIGQEGGTEEGAIERAHWSSQLSHQHGGAFSFLELTSVTCKLSETEIEGGGFFFLLWLLGESDDRNEPSPQGKKDAFRLTGGKRVRHFRSAQCRTLDVWA